MAKTRWASGWLVEVNQNNGLFGDGGRAKRKPTVAKRRPASRTRDMANLGDDDTLRFLRESAADQEMDDATAYGDRMVSQAGELAKRLLHVVQAVRAGHPCTSSDVQVLKEAATFLTQLAGGDEHGENDAHESRLLDWLRTDSDAPLPGRALMESRPLHESAVPQNDDELLTWLRQ
jgi:hypothetical protein